MHRDEEEFVAAADRQFLAGGLVDDAARALRVQVRADEPGSDPGGNEREGERPRLRLIEVVVTIVRSST